MREGVREGLREREGEQGGDSQVDVLLRQCVFVGERV